MGARNLQKEYIDKLEKVAINPILCSNAYFKPEIQKFVPGKRYNLSKYPLKDYLTVASNQIVFELDAQAYATNYEIAKKITEVLIERRIPYYVFSSGGKGIHIEIWFNAIQFSTQANKELYNKALSYQLSYKHIRLWLWNKILEEAGIAQDLRGTGKIVDASCITFDDIAHKSKLLRVAGGRKIKHNKHSKENQTWYKTFLSSENFVKRQVRLTTFDKVMYPPVIESFTIDEFELAEFLSEYIERAQSADINKLKNINLGDKGYINLESVKRIREGLGAGQRALGAQILSIAMNCDKLEKNQQTILMKDYVDNCDQIGSQFTFDEANGWLEWVQRQEEVFWNCSLAKDGGLHDSYLCEYCMKRHKKEIKFLTEGSILKKIKEVLDEEIVGEDDTKMLMFLLMLSKDFPSKTGQPGWNITGDPMSQNIILSCDSSSGKSWITKKILELFGTKDTDYFIVSRYTKSAMNYYTELNMDGKIIFIEELQGLDENTAQLRVWMSEGELSLSTVEKAIDGDGMENNVLVQKSTVGQPVFITNQAEGKVEDQLNNRSWVLSMDTTGEQTAQILSYQDGINNGKPHNNSIAKRTIRDALKQLKPYHFVIPFADWKQLNIPSQDIRARRDYQKFLTLIKCSAYLHQRQRSVLIDEDDNEYLLCTPADYDIALQYSSGILGATFSGLTTQQIDLINHLKNSSWAVEFNVGDLMKSLGKSQPYWFGQLQQLEDLGYISAQKVPGKSTIYSLNHDKVINVIKLPNSNSLVVPELLQLLQEFPKTSVITRKGLEELEKSGYSCNSVSDTFTQDPDSKTLLCKFENANRAFLDGDKCVREQTENSIIAPPDRKQIFNFLKNHKDHIIEKAEILAEFGTEFERQIDILIGWLKESGEITESKKDKFIVI